MNEVKARERRDFGWFQSDGISPYMWCQQAENHVVSTPANCCSSSTEHWVWSVLLARLRGIKQQMLSTRWEPEPVNRGEVSVSKLCLELTEPETSSTRRNVHLWLIYVSCLCPAPCVHNHPADTGWQQHSTAAAEPHTFLLFVCQVSSGTASSFDASWPVEITRHCTKHRASSPSSR